MSSSDIFVILTVALTGIVVVRGRGASPATILAGINVLNACYFYAVVRLGILPPDTTAWFFKNLNRYAQDLPIAMGLFLGIAAAAFFATEVGRLFAGTASRSSRGKETDAVRVALALVTSPTGTALAMVLIAAIGLLLLLHAIGGGLQTALLPAVYLQYKGQLAVAFPPPGVMLAHGQLDVISLLMIPLMVVHFRYRHYALLIPEIAIFLYANMIELAMSSRSPALSVAMVIIMMQLTSRHRPTRSFWILLPVVFVLYNAALVGRSTDRVGLPNMIANLGKLNPDVTSDSSLLWSITMGSFSGGFHFLEPVERAEQPFSRRYQLLSLSPLISAIDGFNAVGAPERRRINSSAPYSTFAEVWYFSRSFQIAFVLIFVTGLTYMTYVWLRYRDIICAVFLAPALLVFLKLYSYPTRNNMRYFYAAVLLAAVAAYIHRALLPERRIGGVLGGLPGSPISEASLPRQAAGEAEGGGPATERDPIPGGGEAKARAVSRRWQGGPSAAGRWSGTTDRPVPAWPLRP